MIIKKGLDIGNGYCKYGVGNRFASKIRQGTLQKANGYNIKHKDEVHEVIYKGASYVVGEGHSFISEDRYFTEEYKIALLTATALATPVAKNPLEANLVVGIPVDHYNNQADDVESYLNSLGVEEITVDGKHYIIDFKNMKVFIEGALPIRDNDDRHIITIDVGMGTINIIEWREQEIANHYTNNGSMNKVYTNLTQLINEKHKTHLNPPDVERYISNPVMNTKTGQVSVEKEVDSAFDGLVYDLISFTKNIDYIGADAVHVFGGGAINTFKYWKKHFPKAELIENSQYINQEVYQAVAEALYED